MNKKNLKYLKIAITVIIVALLVWFLVLKPLRAFKNYEKSMESAAKRYYELNQTELPTGSRIATVSMQTLYHKAYLKEDFYIPYTKEPCSMKDSWVKVKKVNGEYKYYTYLKCGALESTVDNKGPEIKLNGSTEITVNLGEKYKDPGVKSVADKTDGKMSVKDVTIKTDKVDTSKVGTYEVTYTAMDSLKNKTTITRTVKVVSKLKNAVNIATDKKGYYVGATPNNYITLSGMMFRIIGVDGNNVKIVAEEDIANVDYAGIASWLDYYMKHFNEKSKKYLVKNKYCNMQLADDQLTTQECTAKTKSTYAYIPSIDEINRSKDTTGSFLQPTTLSWTASKKDDDNAYAVRNILLGVQGNSTYLADGIINNYGVRPVLTVKGDALLKAGNGSKDNPYTFGETAAGHADDPINTRYPGEYISYGGLLWRIVEANSDGTTRIISVDSIKENGQFVKVKHETSTNKKTYNPNEKGNIGYYINNRVSEFVDTSYFVNKEITVPIYNKDILYGKETSTKKYKVKLSAPNTYEMFSAQTSSNQDVRSYWLINSSKTQYYKGVVTDLGVVMRGEISDFLTFGIRLVGNLNKSTTITKGKGTLDSPYNITK